ncbi:MAG: hypothetical protein V1663_04420 [archaeon]
MEEENKTYQEIQDAVNQSGLSSGSPRDNPLEQLEQFADPSMPMAPPAPQAQIPEVPVPQQDSQYSYYPQQQPVRQTQLSTEQIQEVAESIIEEKFDEFTSRIGNIPLWREKVNTDIISIKQELIRTQERFNQLQNIFVGKINEYNQSISNVSSEMKALEQVMQKIIEPLSTNVKELSKITEKLKSKS